MSAPPTLAVLAPHTALPLLFTEVGRKPPWNQPQLTPLAFRRSPMFRPLTVTLFGFGEEQSSNAGFGSPMITPFTTPPGTDRGVAPLVRPAMRLSAPGVEGPNWLP